MEIKTLSHEVKDVDESKGLVKAYFSKFGNVDSYKEITAESAFNKSMLEGIGRIKHFKNHDKNIAIGKIQEIGKEDGHAYFVSKLSQNTAGKDAMIEYKDGLITEHSYGYDVINHMMKDNIKVLTEVKLWEVSSLTGWGANSETPMVWMKSLQTEDDIVKAIEMLEKAISITAFSDEYILKCYEKITFFNDLLRVKLPIKEDLTKFKSLLKF
jgi:HK97 family phage prohead protease